MTFTLADIERLPPETRARIRESVVREARIREARSSLAAWTEYAPPTIRGPFVLSKWQRKLCEALERFSRAAAAGLAPRLILCAPPQFGKSEVVSRRWPVYYLGTYGGILAVCSYAESLALEHSRGAREIAHSEEAHDVWPDLRPKKRGGFGYRRNDVDLISNWSTGEDIPGRYVAVGVGGPLTGKSPQVIVVDDPFKDAAQAGSETYRERVWSWFRSVVYTRARANGSGILVMHTRWEDNDLVGKLLQDAREGGDQWEVINFPNEAEDDDILGRAPGELLDPSRMDAAATALAKRHAREYAALYQQRPAPAEGALFRRIWMEHTYRLPPREQARACDRVWLSCDPNRKRTKAGSLAVVQVWGQHGSYRMLLHRWAERCDYPELRAAIRSISRDWSTYPNLIEGAASGDALVTDLQGEVDGIIPVQPMPSPDRKFTEAQAATGLWEAGQVLLPLPEHAPWVDEVRELIAAFPYGASNDDVDTMSQALQWSREHGHDLAAYLATAASAW